MPSSGGSEETPGYTIETLFNVYYRLSPTSPTSVSYSGMPPVSHVRGFRLNQEPRRYIGIRCLRTDREIRPAKTPGPVTDPIKASLTPDTIY
eukprot:1377492-Pyramimonas_sp.AAC.1